MNTEEAIKNIVTYGYYADDLPMQVVKALDMAVAALRAQQEVEKNEPLTLEELMQMDGEPVWVSNSKIMHIDGFCDEWAIVSCNRQDVESIGTIYHFENYGRTWLAYRYKPKEG